MPIANAKSSVSAPERNIKSLRGYHKLSSAAKAFHFDFRNKVVLDIGSSTGGFTQYALDHGAKKVIAVEKGTNQMLKSLKLDKRVELHEKTDIFDVKFGAGVAGVAEKVFLKDHLRFSSPETYIPAGAEKVAQRAIFPGRPAYDVEGEKVGPEKDLSDRTPAPDVILADVSFVSLKDILFYAKKYLAGAKTDFLVMLKPQFEAKPKDKINGIVKNEKLRRQIIKDFEFWLKQNNFVIIKKQDNVLTGKFGNKERFYYLRLAK